MNPVILALLVALVGIVPTAIYAAVTFAAAVVIGWLLGRLGYERYVRDVMVEGWPRATPSASGERFPSRSASFGRSSPTFSSVRASGRSSTGSSPGT